MDPIVEFDAGRGPQVAGEPAGARLLRYLENECRFLTQAEPPTTAQVAAVLHALADHTAIMAALAYRPDDTSPWPEATSMGRWFHDTADQLTLATHVLPPAGGRDE